LRSCPDRALDDESQAKKGLTIMIISTLGGTGKAEGHAGIVTPTSSSSVHLWWGSRGWRAG
jgi:hypothetical protein